MRQYLGVNIKIEEGTGPLQDGLTASAITKYGTSLRITYAGTRFDNQALAVQAIIDAIAAEELQHAKQGERRAS